MSSYSHRAPLSRRWSALLLALLFLVTASAQAVHTHRNSLPSPKQLTDSLDSNAAARCPVCLHSQVAPLGSLALSVSPHLAAETAVPASPLEARACGEKWVHRVRPPPVV